MSPRWNSSVQLYHNWKRRRLSCGCVRASADWFSLPHWATNSDHLCGGAWSTSGTHARRNTYTWGGEWMTGLTTTQGSYWWHHYWAYGYSTLYMFRGPFNLHHGSFKGMTPVAFFLNYSIWSAPVVNRILILADHDGTYGNYQQSHLWPSITADVSFLALSCTSNHFAILIFAPKSANKMHKTPFAL